MIKPKGTASTKGSQGDLEKLLTHAEDQLPGISELLQVYGGYEEMLLEAQQYLEATQSKPFVTTSNQACPDEVGVYL
mgnify:CR=1 FL=1